MNYCTRIWIVLSLKVILGDKIPSDFRKVAGPQPNQVDYDEAKLLPHFFEHDDHSHAIGIGKNKQLLRHQKILQPADDELKHGEQTTEASTSSGPNIRQQVVRRVEEADVNCQKNHMIVTFRFSTPFSGYIYPFDQFPQCILFSGHNSDEAILTLHYGVCGQKKIANQNEPEFTAIIEHRLMVQWERDFMSEDDSSMIVRCDRPDSFNKTVSWNFQSLNIDSTIRIGKHPGPRTLMEIQRGEGPNAPLLDGKPVFIGDVLTVVFTLSDDVFWFGANVLSCNAVDGGGNKESFDPEKALIISAAKSYSGSMSVIENECSTKPKIFSHIYKERVTRDGNLVNIHYAHFKAFRFPTSPKIVLQCEVQVCFKDCETLPPCSTGFQPRGAQTTRRRRSLKSKGEEVHDGSELDTVDLSRTIEIYSMEDGALKEIPVQSSSEQMVQELLGIYCVSSGVFYAWVAVLGCSTVFLTIVIFWCFSRKNDPRMMATPKH